MSYRALKRLLGETSLERKCRMLFGFFILVLIAGSFLLYARQTELLAYDQIRSTCRMLVIQIVDRDLATICRPIDRERSTILTASTLGMLVSPGSQRPLLAVGLLGVEPLQPVDPIPSKDEPKHTADSIEEFRIQWEAHWPEALKDYRYRTMKPDAVRNEHKPEDPYDAERLKAFLNDPTMQEDNQLLLSQGVNHYYGAVRATDTCLQCHQQLEPGLKENGLIALIKIEVPTSSLQSGIDLNRAVLISTALVTALLIMGGSYIIVRYVIVKPVKHLKQVSDAISAGELKVRSEIQTGDEFEDLSHAFNRMLRSLVTMQDQLQEKNQELDHKVDQLAAANLALFESNQLKGDFLARMSHELRTPMNSILGFSEVLEGSDLNDRQGRWVNNIRTSGEQLLNLINDILDLAKIEAGKMKVRVVEFSLYDVCEGLLTMFRPLAEKKNIDLRSDLTPGIPRLNQDVVKSQQILSNLLSNAIKFTPEGGRVMLSARAEGAFIVLVVKDTGVGIAPEEQELIFEKFRQAENTLTRVHEGTGLGLSIVRELSLLLGGEVRLESELGRGSTFTVRLPLELDPQQALEHDLTTEGIDLSNAQRVDLAKYSGYVPKSEPTSNPNP